MSNPVIVTTPEELRALVRDAVREALADRGRNAPPGREGEHLPVTDADRAAAIKVARELGFDVRRTPRRPPRRAR